MKLLKSRKWLNVVLHTFKNKEIEKKYQKELKGKSDFIELIILVVYACWGLCFGTTYLAQYVDTKHPQMLFMLYLCFIKLSAILLSLLVRYISRFRIAHGMFFIIGIFVDGTELSFYLNTNFLTLG
jgi:hypothetical protein